MAIRKIIYPDNPVLRQKAHKTRHITRATQALIDDMIDTMHAAHGVGLAAPQVAVGERVIVVEPPADVDEDGHEIDGGELQVFAVINPEIVKVSPDKEEDVEGCLSIPGWAGYVDRHVAITVKGLDRRGEPVRYKLEGYVARIFQHEIDHLDGVLFIDRITDPQKMWHVNEQGEREAPPDAGAIGTPVEHESGSPIEGTAA